MTSLHALAAQAEWEMEGSRRAVLHYREAAASKAPHELSGGRRLLRECVPPLAAAIRAGQAEAREAIMAPTGRRPEWAWPVLLLDADKLAVLTVVCALRTGAELQRGGGVVAREVCLAVAADIRREVTFDRWTAEANVTFGLAKAAGDTTAVNLPAVLKLDDGKLDGRKWDRLRRKLGVVLIDAWSTPIRLAVGGWLVDALVKSSEGRFVVKPGPRVRGTTTLLLGLSEETEEILRDVESRAEVARPLRMPMIVPPLPWRYA